MHKGLQALTFVAALAITTPQSAVADEFTGTLKKIKETGTITIGRSEQSVPFSYLDDKGEPIGYSIDLCLRIVDAIKAELKMDKIEVKYVTVMGTTLIPLM